MLAKKDTSKRESYEQGHVHEVRGGVRKRRVIFQGFSVGIGVSSLTITCCFGLFRYTTKSLFTVFFL